MKKKALLSSVLVIAICLCLIAGSTFALFTSDDKFDISITSGKVNIDAFAQIAGVYSAEGPVASQVDKYLTDEHGNHYDHVPQRGYDFANGGKVQLSGHDLVIERITPGDRVDVNISVINYSNVAISYRYRVEFSGNTTLGEGMAVTVDNESYEGLNYYVSAWSHAEPGAAIPEKLVSFELPVYAGNKYQDHTGLHYTVYVEAVQGNAVTTDDSEVRVFPTMNAFDDAKANSDVVNLNGTGALDFEGETIDKPVANYGDVVLSDADLNVNAIGFTNYGEAELKDMNVNAGVSGYTALGYAINSNDGAKTVINNTTIVSANGGLGVTGGSELIFEGGYLEVDSTNTAGRYLFYIEDKGSVVTINDGEFYFNKTQNQRRAYAYVGAGATLYINGGTFGTASTRSGYTAGLLGEGTIIITGGTFGFDPSAWVAPGYKVTKVGAQWIVTDTDTYVAPIVNAQPAPYEGDLYPTGTSVVSHKDITLIGGASIVVDNPSAGVAIENVTANVDGSVVVVDGSVITSSNPAIYINGGSYTLDAGEYLIDASTVSGGIYQVFLVNVTVNGVLLDQSNAAQYLNNVNWFGAYIM